MERIKIFYIDDDWDDLYLFEAAAESLPIEAHLFRDVDNLLGALETEKFPSIIFVDLNMPRISGFEVMEMLKASPKFNEIPVVVLSTSANQPVVDRAKAAGASYYIQKPTSIAKLVAAVKHVLNISWPEHSPDEDFVHSFDQA